MEGDVSLPLTAAERLQIKLKIKKTVFFCIETLKRYCKAIIFSNKKSYDNIFLIFVIDFSHLIEIPLPYKNKSLKFQVFWQPFKLQKKIFSEL